MIKIILGKTEEKVSIISLGTWSYGGANKVGTTPIGWGGQKENDSIDALKHCYKSGSNHWDTADVYGDGRSEKIIKGWRGKAKNYSAMNGGGIHMIDLVCWLLNKKPKEVYSFGNKICFKKNKFNFKDFENSIFYFDDHLSASVNVHLGCIHRHHHILKIFGTKKTFVYDDKGPRIFSSKKEKSHAKKINLLSLPKDKTILMKNFFKDLKKKNFDKKKMRDTFDLVHILNAVRLSHLRNKRIKIYYEKY